MHAYRAAPPLPLRSRVQVALEAARAIVGPAKFDILGHRMGASVAIEVSTALQVNGGRPART